jgi:carboxyl-terminal processing protease
VSLGVRTLTPRAALLLALMLLAGCGALPARIGRTPAQRPNATAAPVQPPLDFLLVRQAMNLLLNQAVEKPRSDTLLDGAWAGLAAEARRQGLPVADADRPRLHGDAQTDFNAFTTAFNRLAGHSREHLDTTRLSYAAIEAMANVLHDSHTTFLPPVIADEVSRRDAGNLGTSTGLRLEYETKRPATVLEVAPGSAAQQAGVHEGDVVVELDGRTIQEMSPRQVSRALEGSDGSRLTLGIRSAGSARLRPVTIVRHTIPLDLVASTVLPGNIGYVRIREFAQSVPIQRQVQQALGDFDYKQTGGVVIDLRGNPGGAVSTMQPILSQVVSQTPLSYLIGRDGRTRTVQRTGAFTFHQRLVVLVDEGSASAAEMFASAVQEYKDGLIIGALTCGCLMGALVLALPDSKAALEVAFDRVLSPVLRREVEHVGVAPDVAVPEDPRLLSQGRDAQLEGALRALGVDAGTASTATIAVLQAR